MLITPDPPHQKGIKVSTTRTSEQSRSTMARGRQGYRSRSASLSSPRDLRGFWRTALALIAPLPGLLMAVKIIISPF